MYPFADERTADVFAGRSRKDVPENVAKRAARQFDILLAATKLEDCRIAGEDVSLSVKTPTHQRLVVMQTASGG